MPRFVFTRQGSRYTGRVARLAVADHLAALRADKAAAERRGAFVRALLAKPRAARTATTA